MVDANQLMPEYKVKAVKVLNKFEFKLTHGRRHDRYSKQVVSADNKKHTINTTVERHVPFPKIKFDTIMKQILLSDNNIEPALRCPYKKEMYEQDICLLNKNELRRWGKH